MRSTGDANPLLRPWAGPLGAPDFAAFRAEDIIPALTVATAVHRQEIAAICEEAAAPGFDNTIAALERAGAMLARVRRLFWTLASAHSTADIRAIEPEVSRMMSMHGTAIAHDKRLFARISAVHEGRAAAGLDIEQRRLTEKIFDGFVRDGAALGSEDKARFAQIDERLAALSVAFGQNVMAVTSAWRMTLDEADLDGLPQPLRDAASARAEADGRPGRFAFGLDRTDYESILTFCDRRDLRERLWRAFTGRCDGGDHDNWPIIAELLALRDERARLLGFADFADFKLADSMAKTPDAAQALLMQLWEPGKRKAQDEAAELQALIDADGGGFTLAPWDWRYYAERVRRDRYALDGAAIQERLRLDTVRTAAFAVAGRLFGLRFERREDIAGYHPDAWAWEVSGPDGPVGLLFTDYLARPEKHGGAWMGSLRVQERLDGAVSPIVYLVANFASAPPPDTAATRLSIGEARTLFHEFGHALHGLLSDVTYPSLAGTSVARDFVEFPSKIMENWIVSPELLESLGVPRALATALQRAEHYGQGFATVELVACALVDLALHRSDARGADPRAFADAMLSRLGMPPAIGMRHRLPVFTHVFDGGYASAYYSYLWSEALDADAFDAFVSAGDIFDVDTSERFRAEILAQGDKRDPADSYIAFRGRPVDGRALMRTRGLATELSAAG